MGMTESTSRNAVIKLGNDHRSGNQFVWFFVIGILSTIADVGLLYFLTEELGIWYLSSATASYSCGILVSFCLNKYITFHDPKTGLLRQFPLFAAISIISLILNLAVLFVLVDLFSFHYLGGKGVAAGLSFFWNYFGQSRLTFQE